MRPLSRSFALFSPHSYHSSPHFAFHALIVTLSLAILARILPFLRLFLPFLPSSRPHSRHSHLILAILALISPCTPSCSLPPLILTFIFAILALILPFLHLILPFLPLLLPFSFLFLPFLRLFLPFSPLFLLSSPLFLPSLLLFLLFAPSFCHSRPHFAILFFILSPSCHHPVFMFCWQRGCRGVNHELMDAELRNRVGGVFVITLVVGGIFEWRWSCIDWPLHDLLHSPVCGLLCP